MDTCKSLNLDHFAQDVLRAFQTWYHKEHLKVGRLDDLLIIQEKVRLLPDPTAGFNLRRATNELILEALDALPERDGEAASVLRQRFIQQKSQLEVAFKLNRSRDQVSRMQRTAVRAVADWICNHEQALRGTRLEQLSTKIEAQTYLPVESHQARYQALLAYLRESEPAPVGIISGMGGIGKTTFAGQLAQELVEDMAFTGLLWCTIQADRTDETGARLAQRVFTEITRQAGLDEAPLQQMQDNLKTLFAAQKVLVVIDNLEEANALEELVDALKDVLGQSSGLLTSRFEPLPGPDFQACSLDELTLLDATSFITRLQQHEPADEQLSAAQVERLYDVVGGNPQALLLILNLLPHFTLDDLLEDLSQPHLKQVEHLYRHIYMRVWNQLSDPGCQTMLAIGLAAPIDLDFEHLQALTELSRAQLRSTILELSQHRLLLTHGNPDRRRYAIHRLTETFLRSDLLPPGLNI
jgi:hypothetical protein